MRISDWSSDVCSSDLGCTSTSAPTSPTGCSTCSTTSACPMRRGPTWPARPAPPRERPPPPPPRWGDRKRVLEGKSVSGRVDLGGRRLIKKTKKQLTNQYKTYNISKNPPQHHT